MKFLQGKKSHIIAVLIGLTTGAYHMGWIDTATLLTLLAILDAGAISAIRAGIAKGQST